MSLSKLDVSGTLGRARELVKEDQTISPAIRSLIEVLVMIVELLLTKIGTSSRNSSVPPSQDPKRTRGRHNASGKKEPKRKPGGQAGHKGTTLAKVDNPDHVEELSIDRRTIPSGVSYTRLEDEVRQVIDIEISRKVTEYRAEVLQDEAGKVYQASFPEGVTRPVQYGASVKAHAVYLSVFQLTPYQRLQQHFFDSAGIKLSAATLCSMVKEGAKLLDTLGFATIVRRQLLASPICNFDETGVNINGKLHWLHSASNEDWTLYKVHQKRGTEGIDALDILPHYKGIACHDHWKSYFSYTECTHALCNAHHLRELQGVLDNEGYKWAEKMKVFLLKVSQKIATQGAPLTAQQQGIYRAQYREIITEGEKECPVVKSKSAGKKKVKQTKARNLLTRFRDFEDEVLLFTTSIEVPFTNNLSERDIRMAKVQQKISGCFRSMAGADAFLLLRSFISTCTKNDISPGEALKILFSGKLPEFLNSA